LILLLQVIALVPQHQCKAELDRLWRVVDARHKQSFSKKWKQTSPKSQPAEGQNSLHLISTLILAYFAS
jgi:hypothetical protein